jgi:uncharacterized membrane protein YdjX (TVP38/TMEM64 family)
VYTVFSATAGAILSFYLAKLLGSRSLKKKISTSEKIGRWQKKLKGNGFYFIFILRVIPIVNFDLVSFLAGISRLKFRPYIFATLLGVLPGTLAANLVGDSLTEGNVTRLAIAGGLFLFATIAAIYFKNKNLFFNRYREEDNA